MSPCSPGRNVRLLAVLCAVLAIAPACTDALFTPAARLPAGLSFALSSVSVAGGPGEAFDRVDAAAVRILRQGAVVLDTTIALPPGEPEHRIRVPIELATDQEQLTAEVVLRAAAEPLFRWEGRVSLRRGETAEAVADLDPVVVRIEAPDSVPMMTAIGDTVRLIATGYFATGDTVRSASILWSAADGAVDVAANGVVVSRDNGEARIVARVGDVTDTVRVRTLQAVHSVVPVTAATDSVFTGFELRYVARDRRGVELRLPVSWTSQQPGIADVAPSGHVLGVSTGSATITAAGGGGTAQAAARVTAPARTSVFASADYTCGLASNGAAHCWGLNSTGQLGTSNAPWIGEARPVAVTGGVVFETLAVGETTTCGLTPAGTAYCWGYNEGGQVGDGSATTQWPYAVIEPRPVAGGLVFTAIAVAGGWPRDNHACAIATDGRAYCWGDNGQGQLGNGSTSGSATPVPVAGGLRFTHISAGYGFTCAIAIDGRAFCWGRNDAGQLGTGNGNGASAVPVEVTGSVRFARLDSGRAHTCAIDRSHALFCWGDNPTGALGTGSSGAALPTPTAIAPAIRFVAISAGGNHTCGITLTAGAYCWGGNHPGALAIGSVNDSHVPQPVVGGTAFRTIDAGGSHTCAVDAAGRASCWGDKGHGKLGEGSIGYADTPVPVSGGRSFTMVTAGQSFTCGVETGGAGFCWGINWTGQLGNGAASRAGFAVPGPVQGGHTFSTITAGMNHACGLATSGAAYCWGANGGRQLGDGTAAARSLVPVAVSGGISFTQLTAGRVHTCGIDMTGRALCWGTNDAGQLGDGTTTTRAVPTPVAGGHRFTSLRAAGWHTCGVTDTGAGYCWGNNASGELGDGSQAHSLVPVAVAGGLRFTEVVAARNFWSPENGYSCGVTESGELYCWGSSDGCRLGNGRCDPLLQPVPGPVTSGSGFRSLDSSASGSCALSVDGAIHCWASNWMGELGIGHKRELIGATSTDPGTPHPVPVAGGLVFASVSAASEHRCGVTTAGAVYCWGKYQWGALGNGALQWIHAPKQVDGGIVFR
jgi:alpha-tubulin suppressor-like RCC1 family protein